MNFQTLEALLDRMRALGVKKLYAKPLAENDNSKQQIYLGGSFDVLRQFPFTNIREEIEGKRANFKASLNLSWINSCPQEAPAPHAQLILYPDYPEVRLSGFLRGCVLSPSIHMRPIPACERKYNNGADGRVLFLGVPDGHNKIFAYLAPQNSTVASSLILQHTTDNFKQNGVFLEIPLEISIDSRSSLLAILKDIHLTGWHWSRKLDSNGHPKIYNALNGGGYTLEALLGVRPNGKAAPDYLDWEIKAYSSDRITLMTPEPDIGFYGSHGAEAFVRKFGRPTANDTLYFTGSHKAGKICPSTGLTLNLDGFNSTYAKITNVSGGIILESTAGFVSAGWSYSRLIQHWATKHAAAAYIPYIRNKTEPPEYYYKTPVYLGEGTSFELFLTAIHNGVVIFDPASKVTDASTARSRVKARSQFRIPVKKLADLYRAFSTVAL